MKDYTETNMKPALYATYYAMLRETAMNNGYALAIHGSLLNDMDLIAIPWIEEPSSPLDLVKSLMDKIGMGYLDENYLESMKELKPHGRIAYSLSSGGGGYIDISIMPTIEKEKA